MCGTLIATDFGRHVKVLVFQKLDGFFQRDFKMVLQVGSTDRAASTSAGAAAESHAMATTPATGKGNLDITRNSSCCAVNRILASRGEANLDRRARRRDPTRSAAARERPSRRMPSVRRRAPGRRPGARAHRRAAPRGVSQSQVNGRWPAGLVRSGLRRWAQATPWRGSGPDMTSSCGLVIPGPPISPAPSGSEPDNPNMDHRRAVAPDIADRTRRRSQQSWPTGHGRTTRHAMSG